MIALRQVFKNSIIFKIINPFIISYNNSKIKKIFETIDIWIENSAIYSRWINYINKVSHSKKSFIYKILSTIGNKIDRGILKISKFFNNIMDDSIIYGMTKEFKDELRNRQYMMIVAVIASFSLGFVMATGISHRWTFYRMLLIIFLILVASMMLVIRNKWQIWLKDSCIYRCYKYIFD
ncbi:hypothetical protein [Clostridiisalibacter paucivorans]|uniref:hypothetical protein n=1 Tax=Clostridiisalibacter paucivorans TaxID=408753 RepID=UPI000479B953|nr:hypothetical protein [Clostridiisalibacter paucivorans]